MDNTPGRVLDDRYRIEEVLHGGQADILRATDTVEDEQVAIKTPNESTRSNERRLRRFVESMVVHAQIEHENVLHVRRFYDEGEIDEGAYLVTDWMDQTLEDVLEGDVLEVPVAIEIVGKLLRGIGAIHKFEALHRDLKPSNIFLSNDLSKVCIGDLGGRGGTLGDSFKYTPPETFDEDEETDERGDLYSLGLIAYELLLGRAKFEEQFAEIYSSSDEAGQRARWINWHRDPAHPAPPLSSINPEIPVGVSNAIDALLAKNPAVRPADAEVALTALEAGAIEQPERIVPVLTLEAEDEVTGWRSWLTGNKRYATAGGGVVVIGLLAFLIFGGDSPLDLSGLIGVDTRVRPGTEVDDDPDSRLRPVENVEDEEKLAVVVPGKVVALPNGDWVIVGGRDDVEIHLGNGETVEQDGLTYTTNADGEIVATDARGNQFVLDENGNWVRKATIDGREVDLVANDDGSFTDPATGKKYECDENGCVEIDPETGLPFNADGTVTAKIDGRDVDLQKNADGSFTDPATGKRYECDENGCVEIDAVSGLVANADGTFTAQIDGRDVALLQNEDGTFTDPATGKRYKCIDGECFEVNEDNMPDVFVIGSTEEEKAAALELCLEHDDACNLSWFDDEYLREVNLEPFSIDTREVTNREFADFVSVTGYVTDAEKEGQAWRWVGFASIPARGYSWRKPQGPGSESTGRPEHPVVAISANDASAFCKWIGSRLPTEDEWEYAARGIERRIFPWGNEWDAKRVHWRREETGGATMKVGSLPGGHTPEGVADMAGNVWEWTSTIEGQLGVLKGGSFEDENPASQRSAARRLGAPGEGHLDDGFRCVSVPEKPRN